MTREPGWDPKATLDHHLYSTEVSRAASAVTGPLPMCSDLGQQMLQARLRGSEGN